MVVCLFGFKTFNSATSTRSGGQFTSCPKGAGGAGLTTLSRSAQVEEFEVAMGGGIWVAVRAAASCVYLRRTSLYFFTCRSVMRLPGTVLASSEAKHCRTQAQTHSGGVRQPVKIVVVDRSR